MKKPFSLLCLSVFLLLAPWWAFPLQELLHHSFYTTADAFVLLGISGLAAFFCCRFLPDSLFEISDKTGVILSKTKNDKRWLWILAFLAGTFVVLLWINRLILHSFMGSADEHSCYFLAECFRMGKWWLAPHPLSEFFNVVHVGNRDGKWFSVYPPGWPLLMAFGLKYHFLDSLNPAIIAAALFFFFLTAKKLYGTSTA
ncbi:MAG: hypothetical protein EXS63_07285, partial [Candidatus Omnitrophica bacterium]|nr:hypothetical protein [Candidatus Omnitrophota bacterium]